MRVEEVRTLRDRLAERDARLARRTLDVVLALHPLDVDLEMQLAHSGNDGLGQNIRDTVGKDSKQDGLTSLLSLSMWTRNVGSSFWNRLRTREKLGVSWLQASRQAK